MVNDWCLFKGHNKVGQSAYYKVQVHAYRVGSNNTVKPVYTKLSKYHISDNRASHTLNTFC